LANCNFRFSCFRSPGGAALLQQPLDLTPRRGGRRRRVATTPAEDDAARPPQQKQDDDVQVDEAGDVAADAAAQVDVADPPQVDALDAADGDQDWLVFVLGLVLIAMVQMYILN
jgi:hypothetical protein